MKILVGYDGSPFADVAIDDLRKAGLPAHAEALVVCVAAGDTHPHGVAVAASEGDASWRSKLAEAEGLAESAGRRISSHFPAWTVSSEALWGSPAKILLDTAEWWHPDLIVVGSHGRSAVARLFLGSVSLQLVCNAPSSVRVARAGGLSDPPRIIIGNDGSEEAQAVIRCVAARSWPEKTEARIVSVVQTLVPMPAALEAASTYAQERAYSVIREADAETRHRLGKIAEESKDALSRAGLIVTSHVVDGDPRETIIFEAERLKADAIFVGARGLGRMERLLLGSVSNYVVTHAPCSVEVVRARHN